MNIKLSPPAKSLKAGDYQHYKGNKYKVLGIALHTETLEELVVYKALHGEKLTWIRPITMFLENVVVNGHKQKRFQLITK